MRLALIAACGVNREIGINNALPWHLPEDLRHFKQLTTGYPVIMGRKTYDSIGRALPQRLNIVISRQARTLPGCQCVSSLQQALQTAAAAAELGFVIGGGEIYRQALPLADVLYMTEVDRHIPDADTFFPPIAPEVWSEVARHQSKTSEPSAPAFAFVQYCRR